VFLPIGSEIGRGENTTKRKKKSGFLRITTLFIVEIESYLKIEFLDVLEVTEKLSVQIDSSIWIPDSFKVGRLQVIATLFITEIIRLMVSL